MAKKLTHSWDLTPKQAIALQLELRCSVRQRPGLKIGSIRTIAGADCAFSRDGVYGYAGVVVYTFPDLEEIRRVGRRTKVRFPYVPGLLSFREAPLLLAAFDKLDALPDVVVFDGHGLAHPRRFGIACHMGLLLDRPAIGCAKSRLVGEHHMPARKPGSMAALTIDGETVGQVLRTKRDCKPVYISVGHRIDLRTATRVVMKCMGQYRIPRPTRDADLFVAKLRARSGS